MQFILMLVVCFSAAAGSASAPAGSAGVPAGTQAEAPALPGRAQAPSGAVAEATLYSRKIQPLFDNRCLACHSCFNAPCQLNLQNFEGFQRGANKLNVYDGTRLKSVEPSRLWIDAHADEWRKRGFYEVSTSKDPDQNLFFQITQLRATAKDAVITKQVADTHVCAQTMTDYQLLAKNSPELGMPYGFPALSPSELATLKDWVKAGSPGPDAEEFKRQNTPSVELQTQVREWEEFLNQESLRHQLVSRYLYEHLFLAHIYFPEKPEEFFRLVRSKQSCAQGIQEIATRRPNDNPGMKKFWYCLKKFPGTVVKKTHIPYQWSPAKMARYKELFLAEGWKVSALPSYESGVAENPFVAFKDIPVKARYQFLLDDAQYQVSTFIKGPVCNGSMAVNSIQEQFYVFFLNPSSDNMVLSQKYADKAAGLLMMPGVWGSDVDIKETPLFYKKLVDHRENYRKLRIEELAKLRPEGYTLKDVWDGGGFNPNATLTVLRHDDNAVVMKGAVGDLSKTVFMLDYPLFERLVYNLVVNFDVFGNVSHQLLTRVYMDMIRMEAEELFLTFLPSEERLSYRRSWYRGLLTQAKMSYVYPTVGSAVPTGIKFNEDNNTKKQFVQKVLFFHQNETVRGGWDFINWKSLEIPDSMQGQWKVKGLDKELRKIAAVKAEAATPFSRFFPDLALLNIKTPKGLKIYSLIHNKEHENISWILGESLRMDPENDTLTVREGVWGSYPNMIFNVKENELAAFVTQVRAMKSAADYQNLVTRYGLRRSNAKFWSFYDDMHVAMRKSDPVSFGYLDLTRYELK
ncbi:fatty acid cis/trans isomerase [Bdellovibrio bacteriovorus]|uniref:fatty acid cis/trans isomerase n=1 Tax=Bdellovibrio bacteriovorus TaxID=959 RepID=UPI0035A59A8C